MNTCVSHPWERLVASIQILVWLLQWAFAFLLSHHISLSPSLCRGGPFSSRDSYVIRLLTSKIKSKFSISESLIFPIIIGLHLADPFRDPISYSSLFWLAVSLILTFLSLFLSLVRKINFICFYIFSASQRLNNISCFFLIATIYCIPLKKTKTTTLYWFYSSKICADHCSFLDEKINK